MVTPTTRFALDTFDPGESWDHTDTVQFVDENAIARGPVSSRPTSGDYDNEFYYAVDELILYRWDQGTTTWTEAAGFGSSSTRLSVTQYINTLNATTVTATDATVANQPSTDNDVANKAYVDSVTQGLNWQEAVIDELNDPPASPTEGDRYFIDDNPTGDWSENPDEIAEWDGSGWVFFAPSEGWAVFIEDIDLLKVYDGTGWIAFGSAIDHGNLAGLSDDDHTQYLRTDGTRALTGDQSFGGFDATNVGNADTSSVSNQDYNETVNTISNASGTTDIDLSVANWHEVEVDGDITITFSNFSSSPPGNSVILYFFDDDTTGPHTITWPASIEWSNGTVRDTVNQDGGLEIALRSPDGGTTVRATRSGVDFA